MPRKPPEEEPPKGSPEWIVTFSDVTSLLVTFFVMLLTFSTLEKQNFQKLAGSLAGGFGVLGPKFKTNKSALMHKDQLRSDRLRDEGVDEPFMRSLDDLEDEVMNLKTKERLETELKMDRIEDGLRIRLEGDRLFNPASAELRGEFIPVLKELAEILSYYRNDLVVEGHTDTKFTGTQRYPTGFELAGTMAQKVAEVLITEAQIPSHRVGAASFGASRPIDDNQTPMGRARNRRVEILVKEVDGSGS
jgi:chemotaxis protein MotB